MRMLTSVGALSAAALLAVATAPPAAAALPEWARFKDAAGATNGCVARAVLLVQNAGTERAFLKSKATFDCDTSAGVRHFTMRHSLVEVLADGTHRTVFGPQLLSQGSATRPGTYIDLPTSASYQVNCTDPGFDGTRTYLARWTLKTEQSPDDQNPFVARVGLRKTVTCA
jgi:hypothetical protein